MTPPYFLPLFLSGLARSEEHTSELQSQSNLVCRLLLEKKKQQEHLDLLSRDQHSVSAERRLHPPGTRAAATAATCSVQPQPSSTSPRSTHLAQSPMHIS